jgi:EAL domain-containing protein (putative c-di-GMP-specific phosphodiesterase class I)
MAEAGISVRYLPITQLDPSGLHSVEAMVQWLRPEGHLVFVSPAECVGMAERSGLVLPVEEWVMRTALSQIGTWHKQHGSLGLSFNLTARQFMDPSFAARVRALCVECALPYQALNLEIHESVLALMPSNALQGFEHFARFGLNLSVDGFGSSVHSESLLHNCPIRRVKLDLRLVAKAAELGTLSERIQELARLAASLRVPLSAEGVVSDDQVQTMQALGCKWVQGSGVYQSLSAHTLGGILCQDEGGSKVGSRSMDAAMGAAAGKVSA